MTISTERSGSTRCRPIGLCKRRMNDVSSFLLRVAEFEACRFGLLKPALTLTIDEVTLGSSSRWAAWLLQPRLRARGRLVRLLSLLAGCRGDLTGAVDLFGAFLSLRLSLSNLPLMPGTD